MGIETTVKTINADSSSLYKTQKIRFSSSLSFTTPLKAIDLEKLKLNQKINPESRKLNEIFKRFSAEQIKTMDSENESYDRLVQWFNSQKKKAKTDIPTVCIIEFDENRIPTEEEREFLIGAVYPNSDIVTIPIISGINKTKKSELDFNSYKKYIQDTVNDIEGLNHKPIMGVIPKLPGKSIKDLIAVYANIGINSFIVDLDGSNPITFQMKSFRILKALKNNQLLEKAYLYGHNIRMGRPNKDAETVPAKDILGFGLGFNSLGNKHKKFIASKSFFEYLKLNPKRKVRLFNKEDYGYWKYNSIRELSEKFPEDSSLSWQLFKDPKTPNKLQALFNEEQLALETNRISTVIDENPESSIKYLKTKKAVEENDLKIIETSLKKI